MESDQENRHKGSGNTGEKRWQLIVRYLPGVENFYGFVLVLLV